MFQSTKDLVLLLYSCFIDLVLLNGVIELSYTRTILFGEGCQLNLYFRKIPNYTLKSIFAHDSM